MKFVLQRVFLTLALLAIVAIPATAGSYKVGVPPGTISVFYVTVGTVTTTGQSVTTTTSYCPAFSTITVTLPNNTLTTTYVASGSFMDANNNVISTFTIDQNAFVDAGGPKPTN